MKIPRHDSILQGTHQIGDWSRMRFAQVLGKTRFRRLVRLNTKKQGRFVST